MEDGGRMMEDVGCRIEDGGWMMEDDGVEWPSEQA